MIVSKFGNSDNSANLSTRALSIIHSVASLDLDNLALGKYPVEGFSMEDAHFMVLEYATDPVSQFGIEFHKVYTDVQFLLKGEEKCGWALASDQQLDAYVEQYNYIAERDICFIKETDVELNYFTMRSGEFYVFTPNTLHMPNLDANRTSQVRKVVIKINTDLMA